MRQWAWPGRGISEGSRPQTHGDGDRSWGQIKGSLQHLAKKAGLYDLGISESLKIYEDSKNVLNDIRHHKLGDKIKGFIGSQNAQIWGLIEPFIRCQCSPLRNAFSLPAGN